MTDSRNRKSPQQSRRNDQKFALRLPDGMREVISELANEAGRSMNTEIVFALQSHIDGRNTATGDDRAILAKENARLKGELDESREQLSELRSILHARAGAIRFYEHAVKVNAQVILAAKLDLPPALELLLKEWASFEGFFPQDTPDKLIARVE
jgi:hypothetical protein